MEKRIKELKLLYASPFRFAPQLSIEAGPSPILNPKPLQNPFHELVNPLSSEGVDHEVATQTQSPLPERDTDSRIHSPLPDFDALNHSPHPERGLSSVSNDFDIDFDFGDVDIGSSLTGGLADNSGHNTVTCAPALFRKWHPYRRSTVLMSH